jgi:hypothetical protein
MPPRARDFQNVGDYIERIGYHTRITSCRAWTSSDAPVGAGHSTHVCGTGVCENGIERPDERGSGHVDTRRNLPPDQPGIPDPRSIELSNHMNREEEGILQITPVKFFTGWRRTEERVKRTTVLQR